MGEHGIRPAGARLDGRVPQELVLSDGSRLMLGSAADDDGARWRRRVGERVEDLSIERARELAGTEFSGYVEVRTRAEAEWLRALAEWASGEAERLDEEAAVLS
ncbi:MAG: hypothetical protein M3Y34_09730 [Actinomycetota bacterium]|nr:hypothetical protein [Actinomycetota bacterium]